MVSTCKECVYCDTSPGVSIDGLIHGICRIRPPEVGNDQNTPGVFPAVNLAKDYCAEGRAVKKDKPKPAEESKEKKEPAKAEKK